MKRAIELLLGLFLLTSLVSAQISLSEFDPVYNLGDKLPVSLEGIVGSETGNLNIDLVCSNNTKISLLKITARAFEMDKESSYSLPYKILTANDLEIEDIRAIVGECHVKATLGSQVTTSSNFLISDKIIIEATTDLSNYNPGEKISLTIKTTKENGKEYYGEVKISNFTEENFVVDAERIVEIDLDEGLSAGNYMMSLKIADGEGNIGSEDIRFEINQIPTRISFGVNTLEVMPGDSISLSGEVLDQTGDIMYELIEFEITSPKKLRISESLQPGEEITQINFPYNSTKGNWRIVANAGDLRDELTIKILGSPHLEYNITGNVLTVTNIGNEIFKDYFNVTIGSTQKSVYAEISPNAVKEYSLSAPSGDYEIGLSDGKSSFTGSSVLTGNAVSIKDLGGSSFFTSPLLWLLLIVVLSVGGYILIQKNPKTKELTGEDSFIKKLTNKFNKKAPKKYRNKVSNTLNFTTKSPESQSIDESNYHAEDSTMKDLTMEKLKTAESSLVLKGEKVTGSVLSLRITNYDQLNQHSKEGLEKILQKAKSQKAVIDKRNNYIFLLFVPQMTRTYKNEMLAVKSGMEILEDLKSFNKKFKQKIMFNLGINSGELVISKTKDKIKYTSMGNTLTFAKKLSDNGSSKLIINDDIRKKLLRTLKIEKHITLNEKQTFSVLSLKDVEANKEKLKDILKRM